MVPFLIGIPSDRVDRYWGEVEQMLKRAVDRADGRYATADVRAALKSGAMQLWMVRREPDGEPAAICITEIIDYPRQRRCGLVFCAGSDRNAWIGALAVIEAWARTRGCAAMEMQGRPGWARVLSDWEGTHILLRKRL